jgi:DNA polymerase III subunit alpha
MAEGFVHLHNHTEYSMLDGAARVDDMVATAKADGQTAIGITDHGNLYGVLDFYEACKRHGMTPVIGIEAYMAANSRHDRPPRRGRGLDDTGGDTEGGQKLYHHLTVYAETTQGYKNLIKLSSDAFLEGYYYKPRVDWELLERYASGLIVTTGCLGGVVLQALKRNDYDHALALAGRFRDIFGPENFFVEIQDHGIPDQLATNPQLVRIARALDAPLLATNDLHYVRREDADMHDALLCIGTGSLISDQDRFKFESREHYLKSAAEMRYIFRELPESCDSTLLIAERANVDITFDNDALPEFPIPEAFAREDHTTAANAYLRHLVYEGARHRYGQDLSTTVTTRLDYELDVVANMGFSDYFLVVWDLIRHAKESGIRVGPGRGSAAGCCVAYCLGIVDLDPIHYGLIFERFLNPGRKQMPDIDMDFDERFRGDMIKYAAERYGSDHVAQIVTFSTIKARAAVRDAARVLGLPPALGDKIAKAMPPLLMGKDVPLAACLQPTPGFEDRFVEAKDLRDLYDADEEVRTIVNTALGFEGKRRQDGIHAAAVVITKEPVTEYVPLQRKSTSGTDGEEAPIVTQFEMHGIEKLGLLKMDFLGLKNLAIMERCLDLVERRTGGRPDIDHVPLDDPRVYEMLRRGDSIGLFQLESPNMRALMRRLGPTSFEDVGALVALYRPGPMGENVHNDYADRKNGRQKVSYDHDDLRDILGNTYGLMIYQEDIMNVATKMAGYSMTEADNLRKACGKKDRELITQERQRFESGVDAKGYGRDLGKLLFDKIEPFADYAFNKSHAYGYALVAYQNGWLKVHYPLEYMSAVLTSSKDDKDKLAGYLAECRAMGIAVRVPDVNESYSWFAPSETAANTITFGMAAIRNVGESLVERIVEERDARGPFADIYDFVRRVDPVVLNRRSMESLVKAGCFDVFGVSRKGLGLVIDEIVARTLDRRRDLSHGISTLFAAVDDGGGDWAGTELPIAAEEFDKGLKLNFEREMLGLYVSDHPLFGSEKQLRLSSDSSIADLLGQFDQSEGSTISVVSGIITDVQVKTSKAGQTFATFALEDLSGVTPVMAFAKVFSAASSSLVKDQVVKVKVRAEKRDETIRVTALEVKPLRLDHGVNEALVLRFEGRIATPEGVRELKDVLATYPGSTQVLVYSPGTAKSYRLQSNDVDVTAVAGLLRAKFGADVIMN